MKNRKPEQSIAKPYIVSIDMGSPKRGAFGWCDNRNHKGYDIDKLLGNLLEENCFAMGIEAPLFIPLRPDNLENFTAGRDFESGRPWSAGAGACVTSINLGFLGSLLTIIKKAKPDITVTTDIAVWKKYKADCILIWESFITGKAGTSGKGSDHLDDAENALRLFEAGNFQTLSSGGYLNFPLAIAGAVEMKTLASDMLIVTGEKRFCLAR